LSAAGEITAESAGRLREAEVWFGVGRARTREDKIEMLSTVAKMEPAKAS